MTAPAILGICQELRSLLAVAADRNLLAVRRSRRAGHPILDAGIRRPWRSRWMQGDVRTVGRCPGVEQLSPPRQDGRDRLTGKVPSGHALALAALRATARGRLPMEEATA